MCGLCAPHCPTYRLSGSELESPRGRLSLMSGVWQGRLEAAPEVQKHLDSCLLCRSCEAICPSQVPFGRIMDATRERLIEQSAAPPRGKLANFGMALVTHPARLRSAAWLAWLYQVSGMQRLFRALHWPRNPLLRRLEQLLPAKVTPGKLDPRYRPAATHTLRGTVSLFTGCTGAALDRTTVHSALTVLNAAGYEVHIPRDQTCCGALHLHSGETAAARNLAQTNIQAFTTAGRHPMIALATGCAATLREYPAEPGADGLPPVHEICEFLVKEAGAGERLTFAPLPQRVLLHTPCSMRNVLRGERYVKALLSAIPDIELIDAPNVGCCGAAGSYMLAQPATAEALRTPLVDAAQTHNVAILATSNIGCALHLAAGLRERGIHVETLHPVTLLARQLRQP